MISRDTFNSARPDIRQFYHNFRELYLRPYRPDYIEWMLGFIDLTPMQIMHRANGYQWALTGSVNIDAPVLEPDLYYTEPPYSPSILSLFFAGYPSAWKYVPVVFDPYYAPKRRVPKTYWTGISRRRRNL